MQSLRQENTTLKKVNLESTSSMKSCIQSCIDCYQMCNNIIEHCLRKGAEHAEVSHIKLLQDCAKICETSANFMLRNSEYHDLTCTVCAKICRACADDCRKLDNDGMMRACAQICDQCAESCEAMATLQ